MYNKQNLRHHIKLMKKCWLQCFRMFDHLKKMSSLLKKKYRGLTISRFVFKENLSCGSLIFIQYMFLENIAFHQKMFNFTIFLFDLGICFVKALLFIIHNLVYMFRISFDELVKGITIITFNIFVKLTNSYAICDVLSVMCNA